MATDDFIFYFRSGCLSLIYLLIISASYFQTLKSQPKEGNFSKAQFYLFWLSRVIAGFIVVTTIWSFLSDYYPSVSIHTIRSNPANKEFRIAVESFSKSIVRDVKVNRVIVGIPYSGKDDQIVSYISNTPWRIVVSPTGMEDLIERNPWYDEIFNNPNIQEVHLFISVEYPVNFLPWYSSWDGYSYTYNRNTGEWSRGTRSVFRLTTAAEENLHRHVRRGDLKSIEPLLRAWLKERVPSKNEGGT